MTYRGAHSEGVGRKETERESERKTMHNKVQVLIARQE